MDAKWESATTFFVYTTQGDFLGNVFAKKDEEMPRMGQVVRQNAVFYRIYSVDTADQKVLVSADSLVAIGIGQPSIWWEVR